jgi:hypothetical protein
MLLEAGELSQGFRPELERPQEELKYLGRTL